MQVIAGADFSRRRRGPFLSPIELVVLATMVAGLLLLLFPGRNYEDPKHLDHPDHLAIAYLNMLLRAHPEDGQARLLLSQQQMAIGQLEEAKESLQPLLGRPDDIGAKAEVINLKLDRARFVALAEDDPARPALQAAVRRVALKLIPRTSRPDDLADLADFVLAQNEPGQAAAAYRRLAEIDRPQRISWLEKAARWTEAAGQPGPAARLYSQAATEAVQGTREVKADPGRGAQLARQSLRALRAANEGRAGLAIARPLVELFPRDLPLLEEAVRMAVGAGDLGTARRWGEQRVAAAGGSDQALREQIDILTKAGDPEGALRVAKQLHARNPGNAALRRQMAQLARWSGRAEESLDHWAWLANRGSEEARLTALELARALSDADREVEMLELRMKRARRMAAPSAPDFEALRRRLNAPARAPRVIPPADRLRRRPGQDVGQVRGARQPRRAPGGRAAGPGRCQVARATATTNASVASPAAPGTQTPVSRSKATPRKGDDFELAELIALADALEVKGLPERAIKALDSFRFNFAEKPEYWVRLARLYEQINELERALACHEQLARLKAMSLDDTLRQAQLLWRLQRPEAALSRLVNLRTEARATDRTYWNMLGDLAWRLEQDNVAAEAYAVLWRQEKTVDVGDRLWKALDSAGRRDEAVAVAAEAFDKLGQPGFLVSAVDLALKRGDRDRARALFAKVEGRESYFAKESEFWFQRAMLAVHDDRAGDAERDFQRVLKIDPRSQDAHVEWLTVAVHAQDRSMTGRALSHWGKAAEDDEGNWWLLSDAHALLGNDERHRHFRKLARAARARERAATGRPPTPEEDMEEVIERRDRAGIESRLRTHGNSLPLPIRVAALRELGRDDAAWALLESAGMTSDRRLLSSENAAELIADVRDLRENYLSGAWAWGSGQQLGALELVGGGARLELRKRALTFGLEAAALELRSTRMPRLLARGKNEQRAELIVKLKESFGETAVRGGAQFLPDGYRPTVALEQLFGGGNPAPGLAGSELRLRGGFNEVPTHSPLLRVAALRDSAAADLLLAFSRFELGGNVSAGRFVTRGRVPLTNEFAAKGEMAVRLPLGSAFVRPRAEALRTWAKPLADIPMEIAPYLAGMAVDADDVLALQYDSAGVGLTIGHGLADVGEGRGPHVSLRYHLDGWAGYLWPALKPSYAAEVGIGLVFARHQELSLEGYFFSDVGSAAGERYAGASVNYTLRWFR
jgi:tetratricopeptide (TPR) repeat protein